MFVFAISYSLVPFIAPNPIIDVWTKQEQAVQAFLNFKNPYTIEYINIYPVEIQNKITPFGVNYNYLPTPFIFCAPFGLLGLDIRFGLIFALIMFAVITHLFLKIKRIKFLEYFVPILLLSVPTNSFMIEQAWNDIIPIFLIILSLYCTEKNYKILFYILSSLIFMTKLYVIPVVPLLIIYMSFKSSENILYTTLKSTIIALLVCLFFLILDWKNFLGSQIGLHFFKNPDIYKNPLTNILRSDGFTLTNWFYLRTKFKISFISFILCLGAYPYILWKQFSNKMRISDSIRFVGYILFFAFSFADYSYFNYFWFAFGLIIISYAIDSNFHLLSFFDLNDTFFFLSRVLIIFYLAPYLSDVHYYQWISSLLSSGKIPYINFNFEYPPLSLIPIYLPDIVTQKTSSSNFHFYRTIFHLFIFSLDLWHYKFLKKNGFIKNNFKTILYLVLPLVIGHLSYDRLDLIFSILTSLCLIYFFSDEKKSLFYLAMSAFFKISSIIILIPSLFIGHQSVKLKFKQLIFFFFIPLVFFVVLFKSHLFSFITYHGLRGVQAESLWSGLFICTNILQMISLSKFSH
ncbi:MAG: hypothetical protein H6622_03025 [Halobacteriovoraceae bacterium]|nr:hypothetical protein [Halobacteriovoraceae bacterium]